MEVGKIRLRAKGSAEAITESSQSSTILELRPLIASRLESGRPKHGMSVVHHVLGKFDQDDYATILLAIDKSEEALRFYLKEGQF